MLKTSVLDNYEIARAKARKAEYTSDLSSDIESVTTKKRRITLPRRLSSSSEENYPLENLPASKKLKSPPKLINHTSLNKGNFLKKIPSEYIVD